MSPERHPSLPNLPLPAEQVDRPLAAFAQDYLDGMATGEHSHTRAQFLYATTGVMRIHAAGTLHVVPTGRGLWMPAGLRHAVIMQGHVAMRALFLRHDAARSGPPGVAVLAVSPLLRELVLAACDGPLEWDESGRGGHLAALILDEIARAPSLPLGVPQPRDPRLLRLADAMRADLARDRTLEDWAGEVGASPRTLTRRFREETGLGFAVWRQQTRLAEASALLAQGMTPARAAAAVGYASASAFGAAWRATFGTTPARAGHD
ncbi:transcriptional regulator, AraC family [Acetobacteraceae bacterium AT-5844]|nr:transcriptional regulator, AraC family [Acetobacteraceae bacterium AT-5844]